jgi:Cof subfamily protein (haloacid dehalogenase superfamily)
MGDHEGMTFPRLLATDLDGTLLAPDGEVSTRTAQALQAAQRAGLEVVFVTARPHRWLTSLAGLVGGHGTAICANGASVVDVATLTLLAEHPMTPALVLDLVQRLRDDLGPASSFAVESAAGLAREHRFTTHHPVPPGSPAADHIEDVLPPGTLKLLVRTGEPWTMARPEEFTARVAACVQHLATPSSSGVPGLGEIAAPGVTKAGTLATWAASHNITPDQVWVVGDAPNDLPMLRWAGRSFAVANAHPDVLAIADETLPSNADDGVATLLERCTAEAPSPGGRSESPVTRSA